MPVFDIEANGKSFEVEAPDQTAALAAIGSMNAPEAETSLSGLAKSAGAGLVGGITSLAGLPADLAALGARGLAAVTGGEVGDDVKQLQERYGSEAFRKSAEGVTGPLYEPKTFAEKTVRTAGEFLPALIGGGASLPVKLATRVALPAVASEAAGALTEGTEAEPYAKLAGALGGAVAGSKIAGAVSRPGIAVVPDKPALDAAKTAGYKSAAIDAAEYKPAAVGAFADDLVTKLKQSRISEKQADKVYDAIDGLRKPAFKPNHTVQDFDETRRLLNDIAGNFADKVQAGAAQKIINAIDAFTLRPPKGAALDDVIARQAGKDIFQARANAAAGFRSQRLTEALEKAMNTAGATHSGGNTQNEIQKAARSILNNRKQLRGFNEQERAAIQEIARGTMTSNLVRRIAKLLGGGGGLGQLASGSAGGAMFGFPGMVALPAAGMAANKVGSAMAQSKWRKLDELVRSRSPLYGAGNQAAYQARLQGGGVLGNLPPAQNAAVYAALMNQRPQLADGNR
jgi:hypothetical protein